MKKFAFSIFFICALTCLFAGCKKGGTDYTDYISEMRTDIYLYSNDGTEIKIYRAQKETPFNADGVKGEMSDLTEIYVTLPKNYDEIEVSVCNIEGEMSYSAVDKCYYLSCTGGGVTGGSVDVTLTYGGKSETYSAASVLYDGVISCKEAVKCVIDHDKGLFSSLTENKIFKGEIFVRLLYDEGCYYYVGVCNRDKNISAYLIDGERGKIIAKRELSI
ncbi:MAG: hypothetical protein K2K60_06450 [Clostridia bacterium]|nr:hypothetical protein [Clostridia bacterium]